MGRRNDKALRMANDDLRMAHIQVEHYRRSLSALLKNGVASHCKRVSWSNTAEQHWSLVGHLYGLLMAEEDRVQSVVPECDD